MKKNDKMSVGIIVGRFQVDNLHKEHLKLIKHVIDNHSKVIIFLGVSPCKSTRNNPLDFEARKQMILKEFPNVNVLYIKDNVSDEIWCKNLDSQIEDLIGPNQTATLYGGRDSFLLKYTGKYKCQELIPDSYISGTMEREKTANCVKSSSEFRSGVIWSVYNQYIKVIPTVDIAIFDQNFKNILLGRKIDEKKFRFIGGFCSPNESYEESAKREVKEETNLDIEDIKYIGSYPIEDWRYKSEIDKITTIFFISKTKEINPIPNDDIYELKWFKFYEIKNKDIVLEHQVLLYNLKKFFERR